MTTPRVGPRLIVANLDCDVAFSRLSDRDAAPRTLSGPARAAASASGSLLRAFADPGDRLRVPGPLDPARLVGPLPPVALESGEEVTGAPCVLAWAITPDTAATIDAGRGASRQEAPDTETLRGLTLVDRIWRAPRSAPAVDAVANHRATALAIARELDLALADAGVVTSLAALERHLGAAHHTGSWVVKGAHSSAGRERAWIRSHHDVAAGSGVREAIERLLAGHGSLLVEPWHERVADYSVNGLVTGEGWIPSGPARVRVDGRGAFRGIDVGVAIPDTIERALADASAGAARALASRGYRGPLGLDAWTFRDGPTERLNPIGELNARLTFGHVALAVRERLALDGRTPWRLELHRRGPDDAPPPGSVPLLRAGAPDRIAAWIAPIVDGS